MLSALLGAICAASLAFAPMLVEPSSNISNNDGEFTSVHGAYYDENGSYGTEAGFYNYTNTPFCTLDSSGDSRPYTPVLNEIVSYPVSLNNSYADVYRIGTLYYGEAFGTSSEADEVVEQLNSNIIDVYINGVLQDDHPTYLNYGTSGGNYNKYIISLTYNRNLTSNDYVWFFDHYQYQLGTDTVGDIAEGLTSGIGTVATGIGGGLQSLVRNIFLVGTYDGEGNFTATGLSTFGIVTIVMASLALALGLSRWVVGWATSLGERNR